MIPYIDGFVFPIASKNIECYATVSEKVAGIWKEYGALSYQEFLSDDSSLEGVRHCEEVADSKPDEVVIFGWVSFPSKEVRDAANKNVANDSRMEALLKPLFADPEQPIFDARKMIFGGFKPLGL